MGEGRVNYRNVLGVGIQIAQTEALLWSRLFSGLESPLHAPTFSTKQGPNLMTITPAGAVYTQRRTLCPLYPIPYPASAWETGTINRRKRLTSEGKANGRIVKRKYVYSKES